MIDTYPNTDSLANTESGEAMLTNKQSPWGKIQHCLLIAPGIHFVSTAGHGGFKLDREQNSKIPAHMRRAGGWYEEDCEWAIVVVNFPAYFSTKQGDDAKETLREWYPVDFARFYNVPLTSLRGKSHVLDEQSFIQENRNRFVVRSAWGSGQTWQDCKVPEGFVGVMSRREQDGMEKTFLIPYDEYQSRGKFGFVVEEKHQLWVMPTPLCT